MTTRFQVLSLPDGQAAGKRLAQFLKCDHAIIASRRFPDRESYLRLPPDLAGRQVVLACTLADPDPKLASLLFAADAARELGAARVGLVAPYLAYMRQDRQFAPGEAITSRTFAKVLSMAFDWLITVDPHLHRYAALNEIYDMPTAVVHAAPRLGAWVKTNVAKPLIIGPDAESEQWVTEVARAAGAPHVVLAKQRSGDRDVRIEMPNLSGFRGCQPVLVDDIASSGRTMVEAARNLRAAGFVDPICLVVHPLFAGDAYREIQQVAAAVISCDTVSHVTNGISLAEDLADAVVRLCVR